VSQIVDCFVHDTCVAVCLEDGTIRYHAITKRLRDASAQQRGNWRRIAGGRGIHWPDIDEDIVL
jgi:hypothetical protein